MNENNEKLSEAFKSIQNLRKNLNKLLKMCESTDFKQNEALENLQEGLTLIMDIRSNNSLVQKNIESFKENLNTEKNKIAEINLNLHNYLYHRENLISQIVSCENYETTEMSKISFDSPEVIKKYLEQANNNEKLERNLTTMDYLDYELRIRKELDEKVNNGQREKEENTKTLNDLESYYKQLPNVLTNIEASTIKAQQYLGLSFTEQKKLDELASKLPSPLFNLYNLFQCVDESFENFVFELKIIGNEDKIEEFYKKFSISNEFIEEKIKNKQNVNVNLNLASSNVNNKTDPNKEEGEHSDNDDDFIKDDSEMSDSNMLKKKMKRKEKIGKKSKKIKKLFINFEGKDKEDIESMENIFKEIKPFPLSLELLINTTSINKDKATSLNYPITIKFNFIPVFNIITAEFSQSSTKNNKINSIEEILSNLFETQSIYSTNLKEIIQKSFNQLNISKNEQSFNEYLQILSNNYYYKPGNIINICNYLKMKVNEKDWIDEAYIKGDTSTITMTSFLYRLSKRLKHLPYLHNQLSSLSSGLSGRKSLFANVIGSKKEKDYEGVIGAFSIISQQVFYQQLKRLIEVTDDDYVWVSVQENQGTSGLFKRRYVKVPLVSFAENEALYYLISLEIDGNSFECYIEINYNYPISLPRFVINCTKIKETEIPKEIKSLINQQNIDYIEKLNKNSKTDNNNNYHADILRKIERKVNNLTYISKKLPRKTILIHQIKEIIDSLSEYLHQ